MLLFPPLGLMVWGLGRLMTTVLALIFAGHVPINRQQRAQAIASIDKAKEQAHSYNMPIALSPEGTRTHTGRCIQQQAVLIRLRR
jgi:1-acyl-sn-glycerol-3-phosphate acyltransferase